MHRATPDGEFTQAWFDSGRSSFPQSVRKTGANVELFNVPTYQCSILFTNMGSFNRKSEFRRPENLDMPVTRNEKIQCRRFVTSQRILGNNDAHVILTAEADSLSTDAEELLEDYGDATQEVMTCQFMQEMIPQGQFAFREKRMKKTTKIQMQRSLR